MCVCVLTCVSCRILTATPAGAFVIMITEERSEKILALIDEIVDSGRLCGALAASLFGQLSARSFV